MIEDTSEERLDFGPVRDELDTLYRAVHNKLEREWPESLDPTGALPVLLRAFVLTSAYTYRSVCYLCADVPPDPDRRPEYAVSVPPLARTLVDTLFNIVFLFQNPAEHIRWYWRSTWRECCEDVRRWKLSYGDDPHWTSWIASFEAMVDDYRKDWFVPPSEGSGDIEYWPHPGQMLKRSELSSERREYLAYLNDWFYKDLSRSSHLSGPGLLTRSFMLFEAPGQSSRDAELSRFKGEAVFTVVTLFLCILSEIEGEVRFSLVKRMEYLWGLLRPGSLPARELYERRYRELLSR